MRLLAAPTGLDGREVGGAAAPWLEGMEMRAEPQPVGLAIDYEIDHCLFCLHDLEFRWSIPSMAEVEG
jgi:hypothetical protein